MLTKISKPLRLLCVFLLCSMHTFFNVYTQLCRAEFRRCGADTVFAFQLRNPIHNGHALLMKVRRSAGQHTLKYTQLHIHLK